MPQVVGTTQSSILNGPPPAPNPRFQGDLWWCTAAGSGFLASTLYQWTGSAWTTLAQGGAPTGTAGGDLGGTYPNPTVTGLSHVTAGGDLSGTMNAPTVLQAAKLTTARAINGVNFDGSAAITVTADASTLTGTTLKSTVLASSLTSVGTLTALAMGGTLTMGANTLALASATVSGTPTWSSNQAITLSTAAQPNITSVGTLTGLTTSGTINVPQSGGAAVFAVDSSGGSMQTVANGGATITPFGSGNSFSGLVIVNNTNTGEVGVFILCQGNAGVLVAQKGSTMSATAGNSGTLNVYQTVGGVTTIQNNTSTNPITVSILAFRTRSSA